MKVVTFKVEEEFLQKIDNYAINHKMYRAEVIRTALEEFLKKHGVE